MRSNSRGCHIGKGRSFLDRSHEPRFISQRRDADGTPSRAIGAPGKRWTHKCRRRRELEERRGSAGGMAANLTPEEEYHADSKASG